MTRACHLAIFFCCLLAAGATSSPGVARAAAKPEKPAASKTAPPELPKPPLSKLEELARESLAMGDTETAARALYLVQYHYPDNPRAEPDLWLSANLLQERAQAAKNPDWDPVLDRFRLYLNYYPKSPHAAEAYFDLGKAYQAMRYSLEAQAYFKLFLERYPDSPLANQARRWCRNALLKQGADHQEEAKAVFASWRALSDPQAQALGRAGEGMLKSMAGDYQGALAIYQQILAADPNYPLLDPDILRYAGLANLKLGNVEAGREQLYHYLNLAGLVTERPEVLLALAESYFKGGNQAEAQRLYGLIIAEGGRTNGRCWSAPCARPSILTIRRASWRSGRATTTCTTRRATAPIWRYWRSCSVTRWPRTPASGSFSATRPGATWTPPTRWAATFCATPSPPPPIPRPAKGSPACSSPWSRRC